MWWRYYRLLGRASVGSAAVLEPEVLGCLCAAARPEMEFQVLLLPLLSACCKPSAHDVLQLMEKLGRRVSASALRLCK